MPTPLSALVSIISTNVQQLESLYDKTGNHYPSLDDTFEPSSLDEDNAVIDVVELIVAAASQLIASVRSPDATIRELAPGMFLSGALGFIVDTNVPDILKDAGPQGADSKVIASKSGTNAVQLDRVLRYLATRHIFKEVTPSVFANNRISSVLIKANGKSVAELIEQPENKYNDSGTAAFVGHTTDEGLKSSAFMIDYLKNPARNAASPFNLAHNTNDSLWKWFEQPGNEWRLRRFMAVMTRDGKLFKDSFFTNAYIWGTLKSDDVVVDVGGSLGTVTLTLAKAYPAPQYVVQDLESVIPAAEGFWKDVFPDAIADGRVKLQANDFFQTQPVKGAAVYFMRFILHDWADAESIKILKGLRAAASDTSTLVLFEFCVPYACEDPRPEISALSLDAKAAPYPLLANLGVGRGAYPTFVDMQMLALFNGKERTLWEFIELGKASGWKLESVKTELLTALIFSPVSSECGSIEFR